MTLEELGDEVNKNGHLIFVRAQVGGKWQSVPISTLDSRAQWEHIKMWHERGMVPVKLSDARENLP